ncbi:hypothetical protein [cf. Phormidesmis sp. LEGE 11477]|uniref:hypothetical protein n=1 Tax=cf. Phormidesmis sp. LEGE 11477 TaxID=1828680 RepID=UPI001881919A|nr:hypothetical protein [cf. Phormidesmis sp. LEGE 11477]MBE9062446.1 hypothetical protein [cf. Phormidesmis sp. LEGE 11477]
MNKLLRFGLIAGITLAGIGIETTVFAGSAKALPGQTIDEAAAWMEAHPTLRALRSEGLSIRRESTPARRYTFHGSVFPPGGGSGESLLVRRHSGEPVVIHSEKLTLVDIVSGVSIPRLEDSLRSIYGAEIFADYRRAESLLVFSTDRPEDRGTDGLMRSHLLEGDLYGYLLELMPNEDGELQTGAVTVMLKENAAALAENLRDREINRGEFEDPTTGPRMEGDGPSLNRLLRTIQ